MKLPMNQSINISDVFGYRNAPLLLQCRKRKNTQEKSLFCNSIYPTPNEEESKDKWFGSQISKKKKKG